MSLLFQTKVREALQKLLRSPSALSRARASLAYLPDMSRDAVRGFAHMGLLGTLLQSFPRSAIQMQPNHVVNERG